MEFQSSNRERGYETCTLTMKVIFLRGGTQSQMNIPLNLGGGGDIFNDLQLSFRDNAVARGFTKVGLK